MKTVMNRVSLVAFLFAFSMGSAKANPITPANDGTGTQVSSPNGNQFDIEGGTQAGSNQFHSFEKFGLNRGQVANFISNPKIQNIIGRVTGGDASVINGLIQVSGSNANLYLMNPAGIRFGSQAGLNVPGSFTATTGHGIQIGDYWFKALGQNDYANLVGEPNGIAFATDNAGAIVNEGELTVPKGEQIALVGGLVINTGTLEAPEGDIIIASVADKQMVTITQEGSLLSLGLPESAETELSGAQALTPLDLPKLLTGGDIESVATVELTANGNIRLAGSDSKAELPNTAGTTLASGQIDASGEVGGNVGIFGEKVGVIAANIDASGTNGGGEVLMGGNYKGQGDAPNALRTLIDENSVINADALVNGDGGRVIAWADGVTGFFGQISARGGNNSGDGGFVEVSGKNQLVFEGNVNLTAVNGVSGELLLDPTKIVVVPFGSEDANFSPDEETSILVNEDTANAPDETKIDIGNLVGSEKKVTLEGEEVIFEDNLIVFDPDNEENPNTDSQQVLFAGFIFDAEVNEENQFIDENGKSIGRDVPLFKELTITAEDSITIKDHIAVRNQLTLTSNDGDIQLGTDERPKNIILGLDQVRSRVFTPEGGSHSLRAPNGEINLFGGFAIGQPSNESPQQQIDITAQRFRAKETAEFIGNTLSQPGRDEDDLQDPNENIDAEYNFGIFFDGGRFPDPTPETQPTIQLNVASVEENREQQTLNLDPNLDPDDQIVENLNNPNVRIDVKLDGDTEFIIGENLDQESTSGITKPIQVVPLISTNGSRTGNLTGTTGNQNLTLGLIDDSNPDDPNIDVEEDEDTDFELATVSLGEQTETGDYTFTPIEGTDTVLATRSGQVLSLLFTLPKDEEGNLIPIPAELFPELLTPDVFLDAEDWEIQDQ